MIEFKDRKSTYTNRRKLKVIGEPIYNNGKLTELTVDVERADLGITVEGTKLNASSLNGVFKSVNDCLAFLLKQYFTVQGDLSVSWVQEKGIYKSKTFRINTLQKFYVRVSVSTYYLSVESVSENTNYIEFVIKETSMLNSTVGSSTRIYDFNVELFINSSRTQRVADLNGKVYYTNTPTNPLE